MKMQRYKCHKVVEAFRIWEIRRFTRCDLRGEGMDEWVELRAEDESLLRVSDAYMEKHEPKVGGYYVLYDGGYASFSPREAFEAGYTLIPDQ